MSTKTIAVETSVYDKLASVKRSSESFTKTIHRLIQSSQDFSCKAAVTQAAAIWSRIGGDKEADAMEAGLRAEREATDWTVEQPE